MFRSINRSLHPTGHIPQIILSLEIFIRQGYRTQGYQRPASGLKDDEETSCFMPHGINVSLGLRSQNLMCTCVSLIG